MYVYVYIYIYTRCKAEGPSSMSKIYKQSCLHLVLATLVKYSQAQATSKVVKHATVKLYLIFWSGRKKRPSCESSG